MTTAIRWLRGGRDVAALLLVALAAQGCALTSKGEPLVPRYFSPTLPPAPDAAPSTESPVELRLGRVEPAAHLEERIAYRVGEIELGYFDDRRWTEPPEQLVRRALERELFESQAFRRVISGSAPTLDVAVLSFEELRQEPRRARLSLLVTLHDERRALLERSFTFEAPLAAGASSDEGRALAQAMAVALGHVTREVAERVSAELQRARLAAAPR
jgi:cholesterol transport system auxiliary component